MIKSILFVGIGSFFGGALRYAVSLMMKNITANAFPWATLSVNLIGCFLLGLTFAIFGKYSSVNSTMCLMLATGFCGGFTTFSTFANESLQMLQCGNIIGFVAYILSSIVLGIALVALGYYIVR
ncbi:MAG: fluoride efflux transporter CrcB [Muribaculaceae bacterium]|nr:fluoride efflux transporter CrcB [Muribaculaceae bacterium]